MNLYTLVSNYAYAQDRDSTKSYYTTMYYVVVNNNLVMLRINVAPVKMAGEPAMKDVCFCLTDLNYKYTLEYIRSETVQCPYVGVFYSSK